jgi:hypothetical protein
VLENGEHELLFAERTSVLDLMLLGEAQKFGRRLGLQVLKFHFLHGAFPGGEDVREWGKC